MTSASFYRQKVMRLLLTSAGIKNASIHDALVGLLGKPIADSNALCIPTAGYGHHGRCIAIPLLGSLPWYFVATICSGGTPSSTQ